MRQISIGLAILIMVSIFMCGARARGDEVTPADKSKVTFNPQTPIDFSFTLPVPPEDFDTGTVSATSSDDTTLSLDDVEFTGDSWSATINTPDDLPAGTTITVRAIAIGEDGTTYTWKFTYTVKANPST